MPTAMTPSPIQPCSFKVEDCTGAGEGYRTLLYGDSGIGKTTLAMQAPDPVFICVDDGVRMLRHPVTKQPAKYIKGISTFEDIKSALSPENDSLFIGHKSIVLDNLTAIQDLAGDFVTRTIKDKNGATAANIGDYSYGTGYGHLYEAMRDLFNLIQRKSKQGYNVVMIAQQTMAIIPNAAGTDYTRIVPALYMPDNSKSIARIRDMFVEHSDHVLLIGPSEMNKVSDITSTGNKQTGLKYKGKLLSEMVRAVHCKSSTGAYMAKARGVDYDMVSFDSPADNSIWVAIFNQEPNETGEQE